MHTETVEQYTLHQSAVMTCQQECCPSYQTQPLWTLQARDKYSLGITSPRQLYSGSVTGTISKVCGKEKKPNLVTSPLSKLLPLERKQTRGREQAVNCLQADLLGQGKGERCYNPSVLSLPG